MIDNLWFVTLAECRSKMLDCENYGYGLDVRRIAKGLKVIDATVQRHKESLDFWSDLYCYKLLTNEGVHSPLYVIEPRWEYEQIYDFWIAYFSYSWQGAKKDIKEARFYENYKDRNI